MCWKPSERCRYEKRCEIYIKRLKKAYSAWVEQAKASKGVAYNTFPKFVAPKCDEDLLEDPAVRDELLARRGYAREIRNRYAGGVVDAGDDRVRAAARRTAVAPCRDRWTIASSIAAITLAATRLASLELPVGAE